MIYATVESMGPRYVWQLLCIKTHKVVNNSTTTGAIEKISTDLESLEI
jgi:hypothetical protein